MMTSPATSQPDADHRAHGAGDPDDDEPDHDRRLVDDEVVGEVVEDEQQRRDHGEGHAGHAERVAAAGRLVLAQAGEREDEQERREDVGARDERDHWLSPSGTC
jgi:hypothetical protein